MKQLSDILYQVNLIEVHGLTDITVKSIAFDSRKVSEGSVFVAVPGTQVDGHDYINKALDLGATAIVAEKLPTERKVGVTYVQVAISSAALGIMASNFYDNPSEKLKVVGVTGTNGKTTVATLLYDLYTDLGYKTGLLSTVENKIDGTILPATHTTPDAIQLQALLARMVAEDCDMCFMEVSSHALDQDRVAGLQFAGAIFTNISHDHLDYHETFDAYIKAKKKLFDGLPSTAFALSNVDDKRGPVMLQNTKAKKSYYSLKGIGDINAKILDNSFTGLQLILDGAELHVKLIGDFNASNLLCAYGAATLLGEPKETVLVALSNLDTAEGRFDHYISPKERIVGIVDYAHTPDALKKVLSTITAIRGGNEKLITIVGCGGDRDKAKRPVMARIAAELSDQVVLTSDNPRSEKPDAILADMQAGITPDLARKVLTIENRKEAIRTASAMAQTNDIILLAGKGHEKYQDIAGVKHPFDDKQLLHDTLKALDK